MTYTSDTDLLDLIEQTETRKQLPSATEVLAVAVTLAALVVLTPLHGLLLAQMLSSIIILTIPGLLVLRVCQRSGRFVGLLAVPCSILVLLGIGLLTALAGPSLGIDRPLDTSTQLPAIEVVCAGLLVLLARRVARSGASLRPRLDGPIALPHPLIAAPIALPAVALIGSRLLDADRGASVAILAVVLAIALIVLGIVVAPRVSDEFLSSIVFSTGLAAMWSFSSRSEAVYGYDVVTEFRKMSQTAITGQWSLDHTNDAYGAMLSITALPAQISSLTGLSLLHLIAWLYPAVFALAPVLVFAVCRRLLSPRWAFVAAAVIVVQANFGSQFPSLARQEIATLFFAALLLVIVSDETSSRFRAILGSLIAVGMVVTHYSTTYFAIPIALVAIVVLTVLALRGRAEWHSVAFIVLIFAVLLLGAFVWNIVLTRSTSNVSSVFASLNADGFSILGSTTSGNPVLSWLTGTVTPNIPAGPYQELVEKVYSTDRTYVTALPQAASPLYSISDLPSTTTSPWSTVSAVVGFATRQLILLVAVVGTIAVFVRRGTVEGARVVAALGLGALFMLALIRLSSTLAAAYNQDRALVQALLVLAPGIGWCGQWLASSARASAVRNSATVIAGALLVGQLASGSSLLVLPAGDGGINLSNTGEDHQRFYSYWGEIAAATWLGQNSRPGEIVYADRYGALRFLLATGRYDGVFPEMVPAVIDRNGWVYASDTNLEGSARSQTNGQFGTYRFPRQFLDANFDIVYSNGLASIYHGARDIPQEQSPRVTP